MATVLLDLLEAKIPDVDKPAWEGTPTELFTDLLNHAVTLKISTHQKTWPKAPHILDRKLNELAPSSKALGWELVPSKSGGIRTMTITSVPSDQDADSNDVGDASTPLLCCSLA